MPFKEDLLLSVSHYHQRPGVHPTPIHFKKNEYCIELVTGGRGWLEINDQWCEVVPGDLLWHIPGDATIARSDFKKPYSCLSTRFLQFNTHQRLVPRLTRWEELDEVKLFVRQVSQLYVDNTFNPKVLLHYIISRLQFQAELYRRAQNNRDLPDVLQELLEIVNRRYAEPIRLADLARIAGWSVPHLHDRFKETLGISPHQALIRRRLQAARELLNSTNDPIKTVAGKCGFLNASAFCTQFKKHTQLSPKQYRKQQIYGSIRRLT